MNLQEMKQATNLLYQEWNLGKKEAGATSNICSKIYLMQILEESDTIIMYKDNGKLVGFCGYYKKNSHRHLLRKKIYTFVKNILYKSKDIKDVEALKDYYHHYQYTPKELENYFDGEISILIVDRNYRGKGIGRKLLLHTFACIQKDHIKNLEILTDGTCNYKFYESCGCQKVFETVVATNEYKDKENILSAKAFIYQKKF